MIIINLGSNDRKDFTFEKIQQNQNDLEKAIIVEADEDIFKSCIQLYKNSFSEEVIKKIYFLNIAITDDSSCDFVDFYSNPNHRGAGSLDQQHVYLHGHSHGLKKIIKATTVNNLFTEHDLSKIDYLQIDCEGMDAKIILSIDFDLFDIKYIQYENLHLDGPFNLYGTDLGVKAKNKLESLGYNITTGGTEGWDNIAIK